MEKRLDKTLRLDMIPPMSRTLYVKNEFVIADNLDLKLPEKIAAMLSEGLHTRTLSPRGLSFPYRIGFNAILFVETGEVDCVLGDKVFHARACSVIMIPSATILMNLTWEAGTRFLMIAYNDGHLISSMTIPSAKIIRAAMIRPIHIPISRERSERYLRLLEVTLHVAEGGDEYHFREDIIGGFAAMLSGGLARMIMEIPSKRGQSYREITLTEDFIRLVQRHCKEHRDLGFYAEELCITPKYLSRIVPRVTGKKALGIIRENVISEARLLLGERDLDIQQISALLGFPSASYFSRYFHEATGMSPSKYTR